MAIIYTLGNGQGVVGRGERMGWKNAVRLVLHLPLRVSLLMADDTVIVPTRSIVMVTEIADTEFARRRAEHEAQQEQASKRGPAPKLVVPRG
jgi:hypothetical protein